MKSKILFSILALMPAAVMPLSVAAQVGPQRNGPPTGTAVYKYEVFAMAGYTSLNQVNQSRYGLMGGKLGATRDFGRHFGITAMGDYYKPATGSGNPGDPSVYDVLAGPEVRANLYGNFDGFIHGLFGIEHTGGEHMTPNISFAGGFGGGLLYNLSQRLAIRASGDKIGASFSLTNNTPELSYSPHRHFNSRGEIGVVFRF